jgi:hypothetical protein
MIKTYRIIPLVFILFLFGLLLTGVSPATAQENERMVPSSSVEKRDCERVGGGRVSKINRDCWRGYARDLEAALTTAQENERMVPSSSVEKRDCERVGGGRVSKINRNCWRGYARDLEAALTEAQGAGQAASEDEVLETAGAGSDAESPVSAEGSPDTEAQGAGQAASEDEVLETAGAGSDAESPVSAEGSPDTEAQGAGQAASEDEVLETAGAGSDAESPVSAEGSPEFIECNQMPQPTQSGVCFRKLVISLQAQLDAPQAQLDAPPEPVASIPSVPSSIPFCKKSEVDTEAWVPRKKLGSMEQRMQECMKQACPGTPINVHLCPNRGSAAVDQFGYRYTFKE